MGRHTEIPNRSGVGTLTTTAPAENGVDRCYCGCKYWENDRCIDCGERVTNSENRTEERELFQEEYDNFTRAPDWELRNVRKALSMLSLLNSPREEQRLKAVKQIQQERRNR